MSDFENVGRLLVFAGIALALLGAVVLLAGRVPFLGRLPGDIRIQQNGFSCFIPLATGLLISIILTVLLNLIIRLRQ